MSLRARLVLLIVALVALVAVALSALHLVSLVNTLSDDALDRSQRATQEVSSFLIANITQHAAQEYPETSKVVSTKELWSLFISDNRDVSSMLETTMANTSSLVEINVAGPDGVILASSSDRRVGIPLTPLRDFSQWIASPMSSRVLDLIRGGPDWQLIVPLGIKGEGESILSIQAVTSSALLRDPLLDEVRKLALVSIASLLAALLVTLVATNLALSPLRRLDRTIDRIVQGNYGAGSQRAAESRHSAPKEFAVLESKLDLLGQQYSGARESAKELRHDVDQLLERMASQLDVASRLAAISRLTGGVAHEIKNPLNAIALRLDFLKAKLGAPEEELVQDIDVLAREIQRLDRVVKTFLDFSRPVEVHFEDVDLAALAREVADLMTPPARLAHIDLEVNSPGEPVIVRGDADLIKQAVLNLVTNAIEAMKSGGNIRLTTAPVDGQATLEVSDNGPGIPASQRDRVFQLYFTTKGKGSGIGLALTYRAVQLHNGTIAFDSEEGLGTRFLLRFPAAIRHA